MQPKGSYIQTALVIAILLTAAYLVWSQEVRLRKNTLRNQAASLADHLQGRIDQLWTARAIIIKSAVSELALAHTEPGKSKNQALRDLKILAPEILSASLLRPGQAPELIWQDLASEGMDTHHSATITADAQLLYGETSRLFMQGKEALIVFLPDFGNPSSPLAAATLSMPAMIRSIMPPDIDEYAIELIDARNQLVYESTSRLPFYAPERMDWQVTRIVQLAGHTCALNVIPGPALIARTYLQPNTWVLGIGILLTLCMAMLLNQQNRLRLKEKEMHELNLRRLALFEVEREERERKEIGSALHDDGGHMLALLRLELEGAMNAGKSCGPAALKHLDHAIHAMRSVAARLHPPILNNAGIGPAMDDLVGSFREKSSIVLRAEVPDALPKITRDREWALFRALQEGLTNLAKHAKATQASLVVKVEPDKLSVMLKDDGVGFDPSLAYTGQSLGLLSLTERLNQVGGSATVTSRPGRGTTLKVEVPC